jgi:hypothetical protein
LLLVEPGTFDVEKFETRYPAGERERVDRELRDRLIRSSAGPVVENVQRAVAHLQKYG